MLKHAILGPWTGLIALIILASYATFLNKRAQANKLAHRPLWSLVLILLSIYTLREMWYATFQFGVPSMLGPGVKGFSLALFITICQITITTVTAVFIFGSCLALSSDVEVDREGGIKVREKSLPHKVINWVEELFPNVPIYGQSICKTSWIVTPLFLIVVPLITLFCCAVYGVAQIVVTVQCLFTGQNPLNSWAAVHGLKHWPEPKMCRIGKTRLWRGPIWWVGLGACLWLIATFFINRPNLILPMGMGAAVVGVTCSTWYFLVHRRQPSLLETTAGALTNNPLSLTTESITAKSRPPAKDYWGLVVAFVRTSKAKVCPKIYY